MQRQVFFKCVLLGLIGFSGSALASGFQLFEADGVGAGDFYAGGAAEADSASTAFFNPAGLVRMTHPQLTVSGVGITSRSQFKGSSTWMTSNPALTSLGSYPQSGTAEGGTGSIVPGIDFAMPINDEFYFGFSEAVPFGLSTDWGRDSFLRYNATKTDLEVFDFSPVIGFKVTNNFSLGAGPDFDYLDATINSMAGVPTAAIYGGHIPTFFDTRSENDASGWGYGWHVGALYQFTPCTRVGLSYRSKVSFGVSGKSKFIGTLAGGSLSSPVFSELENDNLSADTTLPASTILSIYHQIDRSWAVMGTVAYTQWSVFNQLVLRNIQGVDNYLNSATTNAVIPQGYQNTWRAAAGVSFQPIQLPKWKFRAGVGYDQNPTVPYYRNIRLPDGNRTAIALGAHYQATQAFGVDAGWTHLFFQDGQVNGSQTVGSQITTVNGVARTSADLLGVQLTWDFI